ncbi:MAG: LPXTG cell wall anchor domain-containing protein [Ruminococcus sp.]|nr:LPXTG cell wall anchor domain-containing protein [Ruminococcus sp.]MBP3761816.1 LPXTG cell wall anchor domain-containing protein [Ruminococcus sp.]
MLYDLMAIAADAPATGDNFPIKIIIIVAVVAAAVAGGTAVFTKKKK